MSSASSGVSGAATREETPSSDEVTLTTSPSKRNVLHIDLDSDDDCILEPAPSSSTPRSPSRRIGHAADPVASSSRSVKSQAQGRVPFRPGVRQPGSRSAVKSSGSGLRGGVRRPTARGGMKGSFNRAAPRAVKMERADSVSSSLSGTTEKRAAAVKAADVVLPALLSVQVDILETALASSSLPPLISGAYPLQVETCLTCTSVQYTGRSIEPAPAQVSRQSMLLPFRPRRSCVRSAQFRTSHLVPDPPIPLHLSVHSPHSDPDVHTQLRGLTLSITIFASNTLEIFHRVELVDERRELPRKGEARLGADKDGEGIRLRWSTNVPRVATSVGAHARSRVDRSGALQKPTIKGILEDALEIEEAKLKEELRGDLDYLANLDSVTLAAPRSDPTSRRASFRPDGTPSVSRRTKTPLPLSSPSAKVHADTSPVPPSDYVAFRTMGSPYPAAGTDLPPMTSYPSITPRVPSDAPLEEKEAVNDDWLVKHLDALLLGHDEKAFFAVGDLFAPPLLQTRRDFAALQTLLASLALSPSLLENAEYVDQRWGYERFLVEDHESALPELGSALDVFQARTGRRAWEVQHSSRSPQQAIANRPTPICCLLCGAPSCSVHSSEFYSENVPTRSYAYLQQKKEKALSSTDGCSCLGKVATTPWTDEDTGRLTEYNLRFPDMTCCQLATLLQGKTCAEVAGRLPNPVPPSPPPLYYSQVDTALKRSKPLGPKSLPMERSLGYDACLCTGHCSTSTATTTEGCECVSYKTWCDRFCGCASTCPRRWRGCKCAASGSSACQDDCPCALANRECDPHLCAHYPAFSTCRNSQIRRGQIARTLVIESTNSFAGYGLAVVDEARTGDLIGLYGGEYFYLDENFGRVSQLQSDLVRVSYWFDVNENAAVNSEILGNSVRYINMLRENFNCEARVIYINGVQQMAIFATQNLAPGEELSLDYGEGYPKYWEQVQREDSED